GGPGRPGTRSCTASAGRRTPWRRRSANRAAVIAAPVEPALAIAWERPSATSRAARTTDAPGLDRTAATGSSSLVISSRAGTSSAPAICSTGASAEGSPNTRSRIPSAAAARTPATIASGPRSAPRPSRATVGTELLLGLRGLSGGRLGDLVFDHLASSVRPAYRADSMRQAGAMAARALVQPRRADRVGRAALVPARTGGPFLRDGHAK